VRIRGGGSDTDGGTASVIAMIWTSLKTDFQSHVFVPVMEPCNSCLVGRVRYVKAYYARGFESLQSSCSYWLTIGYLLDSVRSRQTERS
jgi:hypothetical protein